MREIFTNFWNKKTVRYPIVVVLLIIGVVFLFREDHTLKVNDFIGYWSASRVFIERGNPYSIIGISNIQTQAGLMTQQLHVMYNPPWILPLLILFGLLKRTDGQMLWIIAQVAALFFCSVQIWRLYRGQLKHRWVALLVTFTFGPVIYAIIFQGQISPFILLGLVGFLMCVDQPGKEWLAGLFIILITIKPQVPYLFLLAILFWLVAKKKWSIVISFVSFFSLLNIFVLSINPKIFSQFFQCIFTNTPTQWGTPTIGTFLRLIFNPTSFWLVFLPPLLGVTWFMFYWKRKTNLWNWKIDTQIILFVSVITSAYIWTYDLVVLLIPLLAVVTWQLYENKIWVSTVFSTLYIVINLLFLRLHLIMDDLKFIWFAPVIFIWYLLAHYVQNHINQKFVTNPLA